jgi:hypothetical protein
LIHRRFPSVGFLWMFTALAYPAPNDCPHG